MIIQLAWKRDNEYYRKAYRYVLTWRELFILQTKYVHIKSSTVYAPRRNWDSPQPPTRRLVCPLPPVSGGRGTVEHSLARKGLGESQFRRGAYTVVLFICTYFVILHEESEGRWKQREAGRERADILRADIFCLHKKFYWIPALFHLFSFLLLTYWVVHTVHTLQTV